MVEKYPLNFDNKEGSQHIVIKCLKGLLNNEPISNILEMYLQYLCIITKSKYGLLGHRIEKHDTVGVSYRYYGVYGIDKSSTQYKEYKYKGYYEDNSHNMHIDLVDGKSIYFNDLKHRNKPLPEGHVDIKKVIFIPLKDINDRVIGVLSLSGDNNYTDEFINIHQYWIELSSVFLQITLDRKHLIRSRDNFLANISNELRTPLSGIMCMNNLIMGSDMPDKIRSHMEIIETCCTQLLDLTNDILDYTNIATDNIKIKNEPILIPDIMDSLEVLVQDRIKPGVKLLINIDNSVLNTLMGDKTRILQVLMNIVDNSSKFTKQGYIKIDINLKSVTSTTHSINFIVEDTGSGIDPCNMDNVFDIINSSQSSYLTSQCGIGLGLSITKHIVHLYGGSIDITSIVGVGTKVTFDMSFDLSINIIDIDNILKDKDVLIYISDYNISDIAFDLLSSISARPVIVNDLLGFNRYINRAGNSFNFYMILTDNTITTEDIITVYSTAKTKEDIKEDIIKVFKTKLPDSDSSNSPTVVNNTIEKHIYNKRSNYRILIAEDNKQNIQIITLLLESIGYNINNITKVKDGASLYVLLTDEKSEFDIAFIDLKMPVMDGITAIKKYTEYITQHPDGLISKRRNSLLIMAVTSTVSENTRDACYAVGMNGYIQKPIRIADLEKIDVLFNAIH